MAEIIPIAVVGQYCQLGPETTWGSEANATVQLASMKINDAIDLETRDFKAAGAKMSTVMTYGKEMARLPFEGPATYEEIDYFIKSLAQAAAADIPSYTIEKGNPAGSGMVYTGAVVMDWTLRGDTSSVDASGSMLAKDFTYKALTGALSQVAQTPIENQHVTVNVAAAEVTNLLNWEIAANNLWVPAHFVGNKNPSGANEGDTNGSIKLVMEANSTNIARVSTRTELAFEFAFNNGGGSTFNVKCNGILEGVEPFSAVGEIYAIGLTYKITNTKVSGTDYVIYVT